MAYFPALELIAKHKIFIHLGEWVVPQATVDEGELKKKRVLRHPC